MLGFVLLYHDCPPHYERPSHWDLMIEVGDALRTWGLPRLPSGWASHRQRTADSYPECPPIASEDVVNAVRLADHRRDYLDKEGPLSGDRGEVRRIDRGTYESGAESPDRWELTLAGEHWRGKVTLLNSAADGADWTVTLCTPQSGEGAAKS